MTFAICLDNEGYEASLELRKIIKCFPQKTTIRKITYALLTSRAKTICTAGKVLSKLNSRSERSANY